MSLPSPPPTHSSLMPTLPPSPYPPPHQLEALKSSVGGAVNAINELQRMIDYGGEEGIVGWPKILTSYQNLLSLLGLIAHHLQPPAPPHNAAAGPSRTQGPLSDPLAQLLVHPSLPTDQSSEPWLQALLSLVRPRAPCEPDDQVDELELTRSFPLGWLVVGQSHSIHTPPPPPPPTGTTDEHLLRIERAQRVISLLEEGRDWRGRVGVVSDDPEPEKEEEEEESEDEDMFGSDPGSEKEEDEKKDGGKEKEVMMSREERRDVLKGLVGFMGRGPEAVG